MYTEKTRIKAKKLRESGLTYDEIASKIQVSKSTLSGWLKDTPFPEKSTVEAKRRYFLKNVQAKGAEANKRKKEKVIEKINKEARSFSKNIDKKDHALLMSLLAVLYWAEGSKSEPGALTFTNTDPKLAYFYLDLLRKCFNIDESRLRIRLHIHYYHSKKQSVAFWSDLLRIPPEQFTSVYVKKRGRNKRFRKNFMGICFIRYGDSNIRRKVLSCAYAIQEHLAPVAQLDRAHPCGG